MIRVTVELISANGEHRNKVLGTLEIVNDGTGTEAAGNYRGVLHGERSRHGWKCLVNGFPRRGKSVWTLIGAFLNKLGHVARERQPESGEGRFP